MMMFGRPLAAPTEYVEKLKGNGTRRGRGLGDRKTV